MCVSRWVCNEGIMCVCKCVHVVKGDIIRSVQGI